MFSLGGPTLIKKKKKKKRMLLKWVQRNLDHYYLNPVLTLNNFWLMSTNLKRLHVRRHRLQRR